MIPFASPSPGQNSFTLGFNQPSVPTLTRFVS